MNEQPLPGGDAREAGSAPAASGHDSVSPTDDGLAFGAGLDSGTAGAEGSTGARRKRRSTRKRKARPASGADSADGGAAEGSAPAPAASTARAEGEGGRAEGDGPGPAEKPARSKRKRSRRKRRPEDGEGAPEAAAEPDRAARARVSESSDEDHADDRPAQEGSAEDGAGEDGAARKRRRRGSRGGRRKKKPREGAAVELIPGEDDELPAGEESGSAEADGEAPARKKRSRSRRKKKKPAGEDASAGEASAEEGVGSEDEAGQAATKKKKSRKRRRRTSKEKGDGSDAPEGEADGDEGEPAARKKRKRSRKKKTVEEGEAPEPVVERDQVILVNAIDAEEKRVAVVDDGKIVDFLMNAESQKTLVNDIYRGKIVNLEPAIGAAFVDFGQGRNGFLHTSDVLAVYGDEGFSLDKLLTASVDPEDWDDDTDDDLDEETEDDAKGEGKSKGKAKGRSRGKPRGEPRRARQRLPITDLVKLGDQVVVQVTKDAIGDKGPTLTTYISIPGRYLVLMPSMARTGVSRKIPDDKERRRLKRILASLEVPSNMGVIVRTAGVGKTKTDLKRDLEYLLGVWETFGKRLRQGRGPAPLYQESELSIRTLRDLFGPRTKAVIVDDPMVHEQLLEFAQRLMPEHVERIQLHEGDRPLFHTHGIEQDFERIFARRVDLPSGGSIVFDQTEALVAIDVNSGRTRSDGFDFEEIALKTNLEAVPEIARQIRLRDLGGIIVCDFIDMMRSANMRAVERALRVELSTDRARSKLGRISQFGLLEMTRQRLGPGTHKKVFQACPRCRGTARIRTVPSRAAAILRRLGSALTQKGFTQVEVRAHPEVVDYLNDDLRDVVRALEHRSEKGLKFTPVPDQPEDSVLRYLRADGREVRPGGRRKR